MSAVSEESYNEPAIDNVVPDLLDTDEQDVQETTEQKQEPMEDGGFSESQSRQSESTEDESTRSIAQWKEKREIEISERDATDEQGHVDLKEEAVKHISDFYDDYNRKKEQQLEAVKHEAEEFLKKKENFFSQDNTTTWDRALQLINEDDADVLGDRDRSKYKEVLQRLKGNLNAPGA